jgi:hypothetical protein
MLIDNLPDDRRYQQGDIRDEVDPVVQQQAVNRKAGGCGYLSDEEPMRHAGRGLRFPLSENLPRNGRQKNGRAHPADQLSVAHERTLGFKALGRLANGLFKVDGSSSRRTSRLRGSGASRDTFFPRPPLHCVLPTMF